MSNSNSNFWFNFLTSNHLIYNICWEDPSIDRKLLGLNSSSNLFMITSAGDNVFSYLLDEPVSIHTVDINEYQNALFDLKKAFFVVGDFENLSNLFFTGKSEHHEKIFQEIEPYLSDQSSSFWNEKIYWFSESKGFYNQALTGKFASVLRLLLRVKKLKNPIKQLIRESDLLKRKELYDKEIELRLFNGISKHLWKTNLLLAFAGVPISQKRATSNLNNHMREALRNIFVNQYAKSNHFWRLYLEGKYTEEYIPDYLIEKNFSKISKNISRVHNSVCSVSDYLLQTNQKFSHFVLLDHQDWLVGNQNQELKNQWKLILKSAEPRAKVLFRSVHETLDFLPDFVLENSSHIIIDDEFLKQNDKVGTYPSTFLLEINV